MDGDVLPLILANQATFFEDTLVEASAAFVAVLIIGANIGHQQKVTHRNRSRRYLCRPQLLPNPRVSSPWLQVYASHDDRAFITTMGVDVETFHYILSSGFGHAWQTIPIPREDVLPTGHPRLGGRSLDASGALGLVLHYLSSAMLETTLQQIFALIPTTVSRYLSFAKKLLLETLRHIPEAAIAFPRGGEFADNRDMIRQRHPLLEGAFGSIDGLSLPVQEADDPEVENATYNGWKSSHFISNVIAFSPRGTIIACVINAPGSWHDSRVARPIYEKLRTQTPDGYYLVADSAFPRGTSLIAGKIQAPLKGGSVVPSDPERLAELLAFNRQLLSYRQTAEWGMRTIQGSFGRLRVPLPINDENGRKEILEICMRMTCLRARCIGINQIRSVYMPIWRASEDDELWANMGDMVFGEIRRRDRVSRYHLVV